MSYIGIIVSFIFVNNILLSWLFAGKTGIAITRNSKAACAFGIVLTAVSSLSCFLAWAVYHGILKNFGIEYLQTLAFIMIITGLTLILELAFGKFLILSVPASTLFPLVSTNCAVLGVCLVSVRSGYTAAESLAAGAAAGAGYFLAVFLIATLNETMKKEWIPRPFRGAPITLISAGLMALAFMAFDAAFLKNILE